MGAYMNDGNASDARATLTSASRAEHRTKAASRWWPRYMLLMGIMAFALIVAIEVFFHSGLVRYAVTAAWALAVGALSWWADSRDVHPRKAGRRFIVAMAIWF